MIKCGSKIPAACSIASGKISKKVSPSKVPAARLISGRNCLGEKGRRKKKTTPVSEIALIAIVAIIMLINITGSIIFCP